MNAPRTVIVVPCYNEAARLRVDSFRQFVARHPGVNFLFVDDGSRDGTGALLQGLVDGQPGRFALQALPENHGKAEAVRQGVLQALAQGPSYVGYWDADLATPLGELPRFIEVLQTHPACEVCFGSRVRLLGRAIERRPQRHYLGRIFATVASYVLGLPVYDTQCGAKLFRVTSQTHVLFDAPFVVNWTFDVEIIARLESLEGQRSGPSAQSRIYELPLNEWRDVAGSKVQPADFLKAMLEMWQIFRRYGRAGSKRALAAGPPTDHSV